MLSWSGTKKLLHKIDIPVSVRFGFHDRPDRNTIPALLMVNIEFAAVQSISLPKNCSSSISSPSTSSFIKNEYDSDDILSKGMSDENSCHLEFNNNVIDCGRSKISTPSNDKLLKLLLFLKEQNTQILKEPPLDIPVGLPLRTMEDVLSL
ncbi:hypothetical protein FQA39_LY07752 [Lamprigera yunnana]|nr:hypothetical protein FQA39_LY07752 [Lamprigera yunnana]